MLHIVEKDNNVNTVPCLDSNTAKNNFLSLQLIVAENVKQLTVSQANPFR